jgi:hypothetical protein
VYAAVLNQMVFVSRSLLYANTSEICKQPRDWRDSDTVVGQVSLQKNHYRFVEHSFGGTNIRIFKPRAELLLLFSIDRSIQTILVCGYDEVRMLRHVINHAAGNLPHLIIIFWM